MNLFSIDTWLEIRHTLSKNKLRTILTMFGVFWGLFMLMLLMGSSNGLRNGVMKDFGSDAFNSVYVWTQRTTMPFRGMVPNRWFRFTISDMNALRAQIPEVAVVAEQNQLGGYRGGNNVMRGNKAGAFSVRGDIPELQKIQNIFIPQGRFVNSTDMKERRKVAVIGSRVRDLLFTKNENPIGDYIRINGVFFQVVGIRESTRQGDRALEETQTIHIPFGTFQQVFNMGEFVGWFAFTPKKGYSAEFVEGKIRKILSERHLIHPDDKNAIGSWNSEQEFKRVTGMFDGIRVFNWLVGLGTLLAGLIGVSNILLISVRDRTREFGIRKSLGATPGHIVGMVMLESLIITMLAGYVGLFLGFSVMEGVSWLLAQGDQPPDMFDRPEIEMSAALQSFGVLVIGGLLAGIIPARLAATIPPVEALRDE